MGKGVVVSGGEKGLYLITKDMDTARLFSEKRKLEESLTKLELEQLPKLTLAKYDTQAKALTAVTTLNNAILALNSEPSEENKALLDNATRAQNAAREAVKLADDKLKHVMIEINTLKTRVNDFKLKIADLPTEALNKEKTRLESKLSELQSAEIAAINAVPDAEAAVQVAKTNYDNAFIVFIADPSDRNRTKKEDALLEYELSVENLNYRKSEVGRITFDINHTEELLADVTSQLYDIEALKAEMKEAERILGDLESIDKKNATDLKNAKLSELAAATNAVADARKRYESDPSPGNLLAYNNALSAEVAAQTAFQTALSNLDIILNQIATKNERIREIDLALKKLTVEQFAWCTDYTESLTGTVSTIEVNGDIRDGVLIRPGHTDSAVYNAARDGIVAIPLGMSPSAAFYNLALKPLVQRHRPFYRSGVISNINYDTNTCTVSIDESPSMDKALVLADPAVIANVPIAYMDCDSAAFEDADRVIVEYTPHDLTAPKVIGFRSHPRECGYAYYFRHVQTGTQQYVINGWTYGEYYRISYYERYQYTTDAVSVAISGLDLTNSLSSLGFIAIPDASQKDFGISVGNRSMGITVSFLVANQKMRKFEYTYGSNVHLISLVTIPLRHEMQAFGNAEVAIYCGGIRAISSRTIISISAPRLSEFATSADIIPDYFGVTAGSTYSTGGDPNDLFMSDKFIYATRSFISGTNFDKRTYSALAFGNSEYAMFYGGWWIARHKRPFTTLHNLEIDVAGDPPFRWVEYEMSAVDDVYTKVALDVSSKYFYSTNAILADVAISVIRYRGAAANNKDIACFSSRGMSPFIPLSAGNASDRTSKNGYPVATETSWTYQQVDDVTPGDHYESLTDYEHRQYFYRYRFSTNTFLPAIYIAGIHLGGIGTGNKKIGLFASGTSTQKYDYVSETITPGTSLSSSPANTATSTTPGGF